MKMSSYPTIVTLAVAATMSIGALTGCSGSSGDATGKTDGANPAVREKATDVSSNKAYCNELKKIDRNALADDEEDDEKWAYEEIPKLRDMAPSEVKDDWTIMIDAIKKVDADPLDWNKVEAVSAHYQAAWDRVWKHFKAECTV